MLTAVECIEKSTGFADRARGASTDKQHILYGMAWMWVTLAKHAERQSQGLSLAGEHIDKHSRGYACGILRADEGFDIIINGVDRSFRDRQEVAYEAARYMKHLHPKNLVEVRIRATGERIIMRNGIGQGVAKACRRSSRK